MSTETTLRARSGSKCELCEMTEGLSAFAVSPRSSDEPDNCVLICEICRDQIENAEKIDAHHWRCLNESMWSQTPAVQVMAWRMLRRLNAEAWARDLLDMLYLDDDKLAWAKSADEETNADEAVTHVDGNGAVLASGDVVTLIKDLNVKGAGFTAKRGTAVRNISLVADNPKHIEGRVGGQQIVILTEFVKKSN